MKKFGYSKKEKLKHTTEISILFEKGKWLVNGNLRLIFLKDDSLENNKIGVSVSKKFFKKAKDRNRIKRLLRETYRLNKEVFSEKFGESNLAMIFWSSKTIPNHFSEVENEFKKLCAKKK